MSELIPVVDLEFDQHLYPRQHVSDNNVLEIMRAMDGGHSLPPIVACRKSKRIVDGVHRWTAAVRRSQETIAVDWRDYASDEDLFREAVALNSGVGLGLTSHDRLRVIEIGREFGLKELDLASLLRTSESYIRTLMPRYATVERTDDGEAKAPPRRVGLKASTRHLSGRTITPAQAEAIQGSAPGTSYLLVVRQLISALEHNLLPPVDQHPVLWQELGRLRGMLQTVLTD